MSALGQRPRCPLSHRRCRKSRCGSARVHRGQAWRSRPPLQRHAEKGILGGSASGGKQRRSIKLRSSRDATGIASSAGHRDPRIWVADPKRRSWTFASSARAAEHRSLSIRNAHNRAPSYRSSALDWPPMSALPDSPPRPLPALPNQGAFSMKGSKHAFIDGAHVAIAVVAACEHDLTLPLTLTLTLPFPMEGNK